MNLYNIIDIYKALKKIGISKNDTVYICPEIYKLGKLNDAKDTKEYTAQISKVIYDIIGPGGTIAINTYTFQVLREKKIFNGEIGFVETDPNNFIKPIKWYKIFIKKN